MAFNRLAFYVSKKGLNPNTKLYTASIEMLYSKFLKGKSFDGCHSINIFLTSSLDEDGMILVQGGFIHFYQVFDFQLFSEIENPYDKKVYLLDTIQRAVSQLAKNKNWEIERFEKAYQQCIIAGLRVDWNFHNKLFLSPDKNYYFSIFHTIDFHVYKVYEILYDKKKIEIFRRECFVDNGPTFTVQAANWEEDSKHFSYKFNGPKKIFTASVEELLNKQEYSESRSKQAVF